MRFHPEKWTVWMLTHWQNRWATILLAIALGTGVILSSCATHYGAYSAFTGGGFKETPVTDERYHIEFMANGFTTPGTVDNYLLHRAAEICLQQGFEYFEILEERKGASYSGSQYGIFELPNGFLVVQFLRRDPSRSSLNEHKVYRALEVIENIGPIIRRRQNGF